MGTTTQIETEIPHFPPAQPLRKRFSHISPGRAVVSIISPRRHSSHSDFPSVRASQRQHRTTSNPVPDAPALVEEVLPEKDNVQNSTTAPSPPSSPKSNKSTVHVARTLSFPHVANIFVRIRRVQKKAKAHHTNSTSGPESVTHPSLLAEEGVPEKHARLEVQDEFVCAYAVDVEKLLRASRASLLDRAALFNANVLVDEQWSCSICCPKNRSDGSYRVHIRYAATAASSPIRDPRQPVELDKASGVPGLMTIVSRDVVATNVLEVYT
ncbi:hypothetical protein EW145_g7768 [Phellinidium pouzarii]|uniref:Uncharacterized protein n=1 Tax=Phellinidium pouzarii TaxID=167371 RepID=A0A4S4KEE2_9AGAM|nr:hypothetical protein EW145_g7768 [Phellinidium pouzarii]